MKFFELPKKAAIAAVISMSILTPYLFAGTVAEVTSVPLDQLKWIQTPFGPLASPVSGDFSNGMHTTYIKFPTGMITPIHTHSKAYTGIVISGTTMHWVPGKPETQVELPAGSHWQVPAGVEHVSECLAGTDCVMAISQTEAFDFLPVTGAALTDSSIVAIYNQVNDFDIAIGQLAVEKGYTAEVRALGEMVFTDHTAVKQAAQGMAVEQKIRPVLPVERSEAAQEHTSTYARLGALAGKAFDEAYLRYEIDFHTNAIDAVENALIPTVKNPSLKKLMTDTLPGFRHHLAESKRLAAKIGFL